MLFMRPRRPKPDRERERKFREELEREGGAEKKDVAAMILSAYLVFLPVILAILGFLCLIAFLFIRNGL